MQKFTRSSLAAGIIYFKTDWKQFSECEAEKAAHFEFQMVGKSEFKN